MRNPPLNTNTNDSMHSTTDAAVNLAHDLIDRAASHLHSREARLRQRAASTRQALRHSLDVTQQQSARARDTTRSLLVQHPFAAVGLALGAGLLLALWSRSSRQRADTSQYEPLLPGEMPTRTGSALDATH